MTLKNIQEIIEAKLVSSRSDCPDYAVREVFSGRATDLLSDLLTFEGPRPLLLTGLTNAQVVRTCEILDVVGIFFVRGKMPQPDAIELAREVDIPLFSTPLSMYESCGRLHARGLPSGARR